MKQKRYITIFVTILILFCVIMTYVRFSNNQETQAQIYQDWQRVYLRKKDKQAFVDTTPQAAKPVVLSEGQGYGMLISVLAAKKGLTDQKQFQQFYEYYLNHRLSGTQLLSWRQVAGKDADSSATDGDLMVAQALIQAYRLWPQKKEYARQARRLLADILKYEYNAREKILTVGNWATAKSKYYDLMRTSDVMPAVFTQFYQFTGERKWLVIKQKMLKRLDQLSKSNSSGLVPDFAWVKKGKAKPVKANTVATAYDGAYSANACRVPMLLADSQDKLSEQILRRMLSFFSKHVPLASGYTLNGEVINAKTIGSFSAPVFYAVNHYRNQSYDQLFLSEQHHFTDGLPKDNYYDASLICLVALMNEKKPK